ncbi:MAG: bifunctional metallophosphatase/5'-nucleotidase, partial [Actinomycetota bacterium]
MSLNRRHVVAAAAAAATLIVPLGASAAVADDRGPDRPHYTLTILHNNDGESQLINAPEQPDFGGVARFATLVDDLRKDATTGKPGPGQAGRRGVVLLSSGDNFLAGPAFQASLDKGVPFYDSIALSRIGYDAIAIGNHEFDFGPDVLADFIEGFGGDTPFLSANLDVSDEPRLAELADDGTIVSRTVVRERGARIGVVGATTPELPAISSPRDVTVLDDVAGIVQDQVDALTGSGVDKIILISHLQNINEDIELVPELRDVDVAIAGGGTELLANDDDLLVPGDQRATDPETGEPLPYPIVGEDAEGDEVPIVTTSGAYKYVGRLVVNFDKDGEVIGTADASGPVRVSGVAPDAVEADAGIQRDVVEPVDEAIAERDENVIAESEVDLEGREDPGVRTQETNLGNLVADALRDAGTDNAADFGVPEPDVAIQNGGGIRGDALIPAGDITELDTFSIAPFPNFVSIVPDIPRSQFKEIVENLVSQIPEADG